MDKIDAAQRKIIMAYIIVPLSVILLWIISSVILKFVIPPWIIALTIVVCPAITSCYRISIWLKKDEMLTDTELKLINTKMFFAAIPVEMLFSVLCIGMIISESTIEQVLQNSGNIDNFHSWSKFIVYLILM